MVLGDFRIEEFAAQRFEASEGAFFIRPHQPRIARHVGGKDRGETAALAHVSGTPALRSPSRRRSSTSPEAGIFSLAQASEKSGRRRSRLVTASAAAIVSPSIAFAAMSAL